MGEDVRKAAVRQENAQLRGTERRLTMNLWEELLIIAGISLEIFAAMESRGAMVANIDRRQLSLICVLTSVWQSSVLLIGNYLSGLLYRYETGQGRKMEGLILSAVIFFCLGIRLMAKAVRREKLHERREESIGIARSFRLAAVTGIYTLLTGSAFGLLGTNLPGLIITVAVFSVAAVISGMYVGYHFGIAHRTKAYAAGALLLWGAGADVIVRYIM